MKSTAAKKSPRVETIKGSMKESNVMVLHLLFALTFPGINVSQRRIQLISESVRPTALKVFTEAARRRKLISESFTKPGRSFEASTESVCVQLH